MSNRARRIGLIAALIVPTTAAIILRSRADRGPSLAEVAMMAAAGRLDEAERSLALRLEREPRDPGTNLLAAQVAMGRSEPETNSGIGPDPRPATTALEHLARVETRDPRLAALARLWRGKAERYLGRLEEAESSWLEALRLDPAVPEAGWLLLQEYYLQGRPEEARSLALRLHQVEPDRRDRVRLLLELIRQEAMPPAPASLVLWFEPIASRHPAGLRANIALGLAMVRSSEQDRGMNLLRKVVESHPDRPESWDGLMAGLDEAGDVEELTTVLQALPAEFSDASWTLKYKARIEEDLGNWAAAAKSYREAMKASPADPRLGYRLARSLRRVGDQAEADRLDAQHQARQSASQGARALYESADADPTLGISPHHELYEQLASLREKLGYPEQADAWRRLAGTPPARD